MSSDGGQFAPSTLFAMSSRFDPVPLARYRLSRAQRPWPTLQAKALYTKKGGAFLSFDGG